MKSILFKPNMIQAILDGRKTMTRRVVKPQPDSRGLRITNVPYEDWHGREYKPKYRPGDIVYVKESWRIAHINHGLQLRDKNFEGDFFTVQYENYSIKDYDPEFQEYLINLFYKHPYRTAYANPAAGDAFSYWKSPLFMPEKAARIFLEITDVRVERLNEISEEDAIKEGIDYYSDRASMMVDQETAGYENCLIDNCAAKTLFMELWQSIHGPDSWDNRWVWVYEFKNVTDKI